MPRSKTPSFKKTCDGCGEAARADKHGDRYLCENCRSAFALDAKRSEEAKSSSPEKKPRARPLAADAKARGEQIASLVAQLVAQLRAREGSKLGEVFEGEVLDALVWLGIQKTREATAAGGPLGALEAAILGFGRRDGEPARVVVVPRDESAEVLGDEVVELRREVERLEGEKQEREKKVEDLRAELARRQEELAGHAREEGKQADAVVERVAAERDALQVANIEIQKRFDDLRTRALAQTEELTKAQTVGVRFENERDEARAKLAELERTKAEEVARQIELYAIEFAAAGNPEAELLKTALEGRLREVAEDVRGVCALVLDAEPEKVDEILGEPGAAGHPLGNEILDLARTAFGKGRTLGEEEGREDGIKQGEQEGYDNACRDEEELARETADEHDATAILLLAYEKGVDYPDVLSAVGRDGKGISPEMKEWARLAWLSSPSSQRPASSKPARAKKPKA